MARHLLSIALATTLPLTVAAAVDPLEVTGTMMIERRSAAADGTTRISLVKPERVAPGDPIVFVVGYRNVGSQPLSNVVLANPIPRGVAYRGPRAGSAAPDVSIDGTTFAPLAALRVGVPGAAPRPARADDVTHVRWRLAQPVGVGVGGEVVFEGVLR